MRAGILARVSTEEQAEADRLSLPAQVEAMQRVCVARGWDVVRVFELRGESAFTDDFAKRPEFDAALRAGEAGEFEVLVVYDMSRFARDQYLTHAALRRLRIAGVKLVGAFTGIDYTENDEWAGLEAIFAQRASRDHSRRVAQAFQRRFELGLPTGDVPFGYVRGGSTLEPPVVVADEAEAIRWAFRAYVTGGSYIEITREFNRRGLQPHSKRRRGLFGHEANGSFTFTSLQAILDNPFYAGFVSHKGERKRGLHEAIVDDELWAAAQGRMRRGNRRAPRAGMLLNGLAACVRCGRAVWAERIGNYRYYRERARGLVSECESVGCRWRHEEPDELVTGVVSALSMEDSGEWAAYCEARSRRVEGKRSERSVLEAERRRVTNAYVAGGFTEAEYQAALGDVRGRMARLAPEVDAVLFAGERVTSLAGVWEVSTMEERREALRAMLRGVRMDVRGHGLALEPWPEYEGLFALRREFVVSTPGWTRTTDL